jgi:hypothetical protein
LELEMTRMVLATFISTFLMAGAAFAQPQISISPTSVAPGQSVTITVTGTPGQFFAVIGSSVNSGMSYAGVALGVGSDFTIHATGTLNSSGQAIVTLAPPFQGTTLDRYYVQAGTSTSPSFNPLQVSASVPVRNADLSPAPEADFAGGSPFASLPLPGLQTFMVWGTVFISNNTPTEYHASCTVAGSNLSGSVALAVGHVPGGKQITLPLLSLITTTAATTVTVHCGSPPTGITVGAAIARMRVAEVQ